MTTTPTAQAIAAPRIPTHCGAPMTALNPLDQQFDERGWYCSKCGVVNTYMACEARS
jgi:hypothetical protein